MFRRILYATDGSPAARHALAYARDLATRYQAELVLVHVFRHIEDFGRSPYFSEIEAERKRAGETVIGLAMSELRDSGLTVHIEPCEGPAAEAIINVAAVRHCDLIIMGSRGLSTFQGLLLGSVSDRVVRHARCPVLVVRETQSQESI